VRTSVVGVTGTIRVTGYNFHVPPGSGIALALGDNRCQYLGLQLPFDISTVLPAFPRCTIVHNQNLLTVSTAMGASRTFDIPLTVPAGALMLPVYLQAFAIEPGGTFHASNGLALAIGN